jgi:hypothetical protein
MFQIKVVEKIKTRILYSIRFFSENCAVCEIMWKGAVELDKPQMTVCACAWHGAQQWLQTLRILDAFPVQQWLHECASIPVLLLYAVSGLCN